MPNISIEQINRLLCVMGKPIGCLALAKLIIFLETEKDFAKNFILKKLN